jgi:hypothetical protein
MVKRFADALMSAEGWMPNTSRRRIVPVVIPRMPLST